MTSGVRLAIERLGRRGEGVADTPSGPVYVPYGLPGEVVRAEIEGERGRIVDVVLARPDRLAPVCPYYGRCGGCAVQTLPPEPYAAWKRDLVVRALDQAGVDAEVGPLIDAHGAGRRRATFHASAGAGPQTVGFMEARAHAIVDLSFCPILEPAMAGAIPAAHALAKAARGSGKPLDILVTATAEGLDIDLRGLGPAHPQAAKALIAAAEASGLARLSIHGTDLVAARTPTVRIGDTSVALPPGAFLQATRAGEDTLATLALSGIGEARHVADLFSGLGTFTLRLAGHASVEAWDADARAIAALSKAARGSPSLRPVEARVRDLMRRPLLAGELKAFDAIVFDPPRAGAAAQATEIARSTARTVVAVSCDPGSFARDAAVLVAGGYAIDSLTPVDQFLYSPHVEIVAVFRRASPQPKRRRLLS